MRTSQIAASALLLVLMLAACGPAAAPAPQASAPPQAPAPATLARAPTASSAPVRPAWELEWEKAAEAAKREGSFVLYTGMGAEQRQIVTNPFERKYGVRVEAVCISSAQLATKIFAEQRAGIYSGDVYVGGSTAYRNLGGAIDSLDGALILPELNEPELIKKAWYFGEVPWANKAHTALIGLMSFNEVICTNKDQVKPGEIKTYADLLNPKWKEKISILDPRLSGMGNMWFAVVLEVGDMDVNFMRELQTKQELFFFTDRRLQVEWLARGKHAVTIGPETTTFTEFLQLGLPVDRFSLGTPFVSGATSGIAMWMKAPHPNAARLFINWLLSQEGQTFQSQAVGAQGQRLDVPTAHLEATKVLKPGLKIFRSDNEEFAIKRADYYTKLASEVFGKR